MANVTPAGWLGRPRCEGCGEEMDVLPHAIVSSVREPFTSDAARRGSFGPRVAEFAERHADCPEPRRDVTAAGVTVIDRRRFTEV